MPRNDEQLSCGFLLFRTRGTIVVFQYRQNLAQVFLQFFEIVFHFFFSLSDFELCGLPILAIFAQPTACVNAPLGYFAVDAMSRVDYLKPAVAFDVMRQIVLP